MELEGQDYSATASVLLPKPQATILSFQIPENPIFGITLKDIQ
ncbi:MAG: hypothetical protein Q8M83_01470 [bacterium]|nr:hypothetical protein [bacterium]